MKITEERKRIILEQGKLFFEQFGKKLTTENGELLKRDSGRPEWSINVYVLTEVGVATAYYRPENQRFTVVGFAFHDLFTEHVPMLSDKFITSVQLKAFKQRVNSISKVSKP
jgi:hypothetical protein